MSEQLDPSQKVFCEASIGNLRLLAPAGCGKTLSLLFRCAHIAQKAKQQRARFLIVTFTVAAKQELVSRLNEDKRFACLKECTEITTLNAWGFRRIKNIAYNPKLITDKDQYHFAMLNQLQSIWKRHERVKDAIEQKQYIVPRRLMDMLDTFKSIGFDHVRHTNYDLFAQRLSELRTQGLDPKIEEMVDELAKLGVLCSSIDRKGEEHVKAGQKEIYSAFFVFWREAVEHLIGSATFTLEDQKYYAYLDERKKLEEGKYLTGAVRYDHILVDEFQDINPLDLSLLKAIVSRNRATLTVVGDDDQAIFEWRGATPEYILDPGRFLEMEFSSMTLGINYRSPNNIVYHSQQLIAHNTRRVDKTIRANQTQDAEIQVAGVSDLSEAMDLVLAEVQDSINCGQNPSRVAIIGRKRSQLIPYQIYFASKDIAFCAAEDLQVFMSHAFERLLRLLLIKMRRNAKQLRSQCVDDILELCNLVKRYPLKKADRESLRRYMNQASISCVAGATETLATYRGPLKGVNNNDGRISTGMANAIRAFLNANSVSESLSEMGNNFEGLQIDLGKAEDDIFYADPPFLYLSEYATRYGDNYEQFLNHIDRAKDQLVYIPPIEDDGERSADDLWKRPLHLMTAPRAKGKEFDSVIMLDVNDGIWPNRNAKNQWQREAERRVFYVAFTRARKKILMLVRNKFGNREASPSPFIAELEL